jgi:protein-L-isoaspartate(D-aspartate) O-methyltransferase
MQSAPVRECRGVACVTGHVASFPVKGSWDCGDSFAKTSQVWRALRKADEQGMEARTEDPFRAAREAMVEEQIRHRGVKDQRVLQAMRTVPRHEFVSGDLQKRAYEDVPLPIGEGQTISQPFIVGLMTASLGLKGTERVLEIGTGCGYQAAVLSCVAREVHSVEVLPELADSAGQRLKRLGYFNVAIHCADGSAGLPEFAPYDAILVAAAAPKLPEPLLAQLAEGGRMIVPVSEDENEALNYVRREGNRFLCERREACRFVPLVGQHGWRNS